MAYKSRFYQQKYQGQEQNNVESNDNSRYKSQFYRSGAYKNAEGASGLKPTETKERLNTELWQRVDNNSVTNTPRKQTANITHMGSVSENSYGSNQQSEYERLLNLNPQKAKASIQSLRTQIEKIPNYSSEELREKYPNHQAAVKHMSDLEDQIKKIEEDFQKSEKIKKYASYQNAEDFLQFSSKGAAIKNPTYKEAEGNAYIFGWRPGADPVQNIVTYSRDNYEHIRDEENGESRGVGAVGKSLYHYMSDDEVGLYNYILAKHGDKEAKEYLDSIEETLNYRSGTEQAKLIRDNENGFLRTLGTVNYGVGAGLDQSISGAKQFFSDEKLPTSATQYGSAYIREDLEDAGPKILGSSLGQIGYDTLTTTANMAPSILLSSITAGLGAPAAVASGLGAASMGLSASGNAYGQALSEGYGKEEARSYSLLVGSSEAALQYLLGGISKLGGKLTGNVAKKTVQNIDNALLRIAVDTGIHMAGEGSEEYLQEILEPAFRNLCFDENNEIKLVSEDAAYSFLLGALTSVFMEGGNIAKSGINIYNAGEAIQRQGKYKELLENALTMDPSSETGQLASQLKNGTLHANNSNIGELYLNYAVGGGNLDFVSAPVENTEMVQEAAQQSSESALYQAAMKKVAGENVSASIPASDTVQENTFVQQRPQDISVSEPVKSSNSISDAPNSIDLISNAASVLGNEGKKSVVENYDGKSDPAEYYASFVRYYNAGLTGQKTSEIKANGLMMDQQIAAYKAGAQDRYESLQKERENVQYATVYGKESGFVWDQNNDNVSKETAQTMNAVGKALGVKIMMADQVKNGAANASYENGVVTIARDSQNPVMTAISHELTHRMQELAPESYRIYRDYVVGSVLEVGNNNSYIADIQKRYQNSGEFLTQEGAMDELAAEYAEVMMGQTDLFNDFVKKDRTAAQKIMDCFKDILEKIKSVIHSLAGEERNQAQKMKSNMEEAVKRWESAFKAAEKQANRIQGQKNNDSKSGNINERFAIKWKEGVNQSDISEIQSIGRKSVNSFTPEDIKKTEKFAHQYLEEMGTKSPFFRAWFGDWRANDNTAVKIANKKGSERGITKNIDTGWNIQISGKVFNETKSHNSKNSKSGVSYLDYINSIVENAVLLDSYTVPSNRAKSANSAMMHSFYAIANSGNGDEIIKMYVEELNDVNRDGTITRAYQLQNITKAPMASVRVQRKSHSSLTSTTDANIYTVSQLFDLVKQNDKNFNPKPSSLVVNDDGTPRIVYHGTDSNFTVFDRNSFNTNEPSGDYVGEGFFFSKSIGTAKKYGSNIISAYLNIRNPLVINTNEDAKNFRNTFFNMYQNGDQEIRDIIGGDYDYFSILEENPSMIRRELEKRGYDGLIDNLYGQYAVFSPNQIKSSTDNVGTFDAKNPDIRYSLKGSSDALQAQLDEAVQKYGAIPVGENPARDIQVPKKVTDNKNERVSQTVRTVLEAKATPDISLPTIEDMVLEGNFSYEVLSDKKAISDAEATIKGKGWTRSLTEWLQKTANGSVNKNNTALGWALYNNAVNSGDIETSINILENMVLHQRNAAQAVQASRILKKLSPEGQLYGAMRSAENLTQEIKERYGKDVEIAVDKDLAEDFLNAPDEKARERALKKLYMDIGKQLPSRFIDKWNAWRYLAMLGNPRTHVRNIVGNAFFMPVVAAKDITGTAIESVVYKLSGGKLKRTKGILTNRDIDLVKAAWNDYPYIKDEALGEGKYSDLKYANKSIEEGRKIFHFKPLEAARKANSKALDVEDVWFSQPHYAFALSQYAKANHISAENIKSGLGIASARNYAIKEAQKATYRDSNTFSNFVSSLGRRGKNSNFVTRAGNALVEGVLPFRKTPANILARGVEYSPIGLLKSLTSDLYQMSKGNKTGAEVIDNISSGLTGTGILGLGVLLASMGVLRGIGGDDDDKREFYDIMGYQDYALCLPDGISITLDWMAPEALPLFVGVNLYEQMSSKQSGLNLSDILDSISNISEPMLEMSMLQSLNDLFDSVGYASSQGLSGLTGSLVSSVTSYLTQGIPALSGQLERTAQKDRMTTYVEKNNFLTGDAQYFIGSISAKIPGWDYHQIPYIDAWGRKESTGENMSYRAFSNMINPAYVKTSKESDMEKELLRLYNETDESSIFPERAKRYFNVDGERIDLTADQYVTYATKKGQKSYQLISALVHNDAYKNSSDQEKCDLISECYDYANARAKQSVSSYDGGDYQKMMATVKKTNVDELTYLILKEQCSGLESLKDSDGETISNSLSLLKMRAIYSINGLTDEQRKAMFEDFGVGKKVRHYNKALVNSKLDQMEKQ